MDVEKDLKMMEKKQLTMASTVSNDSNDSNDNDVDNDNDNEDDENEKTTTTTTTTSTMKDRSGYDQKAIEKLWHELTDEEQETAARTSYRYFVLSEAANVKKNKDNDENDKDTQNDRQLDGLRKEYGLRMVYRFWIGSKRKEKLALEKIKETTHWRKYVIKSDDLRRCFDTSIEKGYDNDNEYYKELRDGLIDQMEDNGGKCSLQGYDKEGRAIYLLHMHNYTNFHPRYYQEYHFYLVDRALAATERKSDGRYEQLVVVFDYSKYGLKNSPPVSLAKQFVYAFQTYYPQTLYAAYLLDTPFLFRAFFSFIRPFVDPVTKEKLHFLTGSEQKETALSQVIAADQASPCMYDDAKLTRTLIDRNEFFEQIPYDTLFQENDSP